MSPVMNSPFARSQAERFLTDSCAVVRGSGTLTDDSEGGQTEPASTVGTYACAVQGRDLQPSEDVEGGAVTSEAAATIYFAVGRDVKLGDRIQATGANWTGTRSFEVVGGGASTVEAVHAVQCREIGVSPQ